MVEGFCYSYSCFIIAEKCFYSCLKQIKMGSSIDDGGMPAKKTPLQHTSNNIPKGYFSIYFISVMVKKSSLTR
jgi:hypothetical protein